MLTIFSTPLSANGRKVLAVCNYLLLKPEIRIIDVYSGEGQSADYLAINPTGKIPFLIEDGFTLSESNAILQYLSEAHGDSKMFAKTPAERAAVSSWLFWESAHWQPVLAAVLAPFVRHKLRPSDKLAPPDLPYWEDSALQPLLQRLEGRLDGHAFLALEEITIADFSVAGMMTYFKSAEFPFETYPNLHRWYSDLNSIDAWRTTGTELWGET